VPGRSRPSFLKRQKEEQRRARATKKREERRARKHSALPDEPDAEMTEGTPEPTDEGAEGEELG